MLSYRNFSVNVKEDGAIVVVAFGDYCTATTKDGALAVLQELCKGIDWETTSDGVRVAGMVRKIEELNHI